MYFIFNHRKNYSHIFCSASTGSLKRI